MNITEAADRYLAGEYNNPDVLSVLEEGSDENGRRYYKLHRSLRYGQALAGIPDLFKEVIKTKAWEHWQWIGSEFKAANPVEYFTAHPPKGMGTTLEMVKKLIAGDPEAERLFRKATTGKVGHPISNGNNITNRVTGTSRAYTLERLKKKRPDLFDRVVAKELSVNAAAILAGWRKKKTELELLRIHWKKASDSERATFKKEI